MDRVGVIGLGKRGLPIARTLMVRGFRVTGYRRSGSPELVSEGGDVAASAAEVAAEADVIGSIVPPRGDGAEIITRPPRPQAGPHPHRDEHHRRGPQGPPPRPRPG